MGKHLGAVTELQRLPQASHETTPFLPQVSSWPGAGRRRKTCYSRSPGPPTLPNRPQSHYLYDLVRPVNHQDQASNRKFVHRSRPFHLSHSSNVPLPRNPGEGGYSSPLPWLMVLSSQPGLLLPLRLQQLLQPTQAWPHLHSQCAHCLITWHPSTFHHLRSISRPPRDMGGL